MGIIRSNPRRILETGWDFAKSRALAADVELDLFTHIANGRHTAGEIARAADSSLRGTQMLLNALAGLGLLRKDREGYYRLAPDSEMFLVRGKTAFLGDMSLHAARMSDAWGHLTESVRTGRPYTDVDAEKTAEDFFPDLVKALFNMNYPAAKYAAAYVRRAGGRISNILDVGAGSCVWGIGFAGQFPDARITALDFPAICRIAREYAGNFKMAERFECIEGDLRDADFGPDRYDIVILGNICHSEGRAGSEKLIKKSYAALRNGGYLLIAEFLPDDERQGPAIPLLFALNMLINTDEGDVFTIKEFRGWLGSSGFKKIDILTKAPSQSPLILAMK